MAKEIEKKFLMIGSPPVPYANPKLIKQGYIFTEKGKHLRIRLCEGKAILGLKYTTGPVRDEYEYEISMADGLEIYSKCESSLEKVRFTMNINDEHYDIDTFPNKVEFVEVEFESEEASNNWVKPDWIGEEITNDAKYSNIALAQQNLKFKDE